MKRESWLPAAPESAGTARALVREAALARGLDDGATWDLMLATTEAVSNAVLHGMACDEGPGILLRIVAGEHGFLVEVCDCGSFDDQAESQHELATGGRGLPIIGAVTDHFEVAPEGGRTTVRFGKRVMANAAA
jgi:anti-sigma regulatory factor (Ser/Thr protein kinase)